MNNRKIMLTSLIMLCMITFSLAQINIGIKGGVMYSSAKVNGIDASLLEKSIQNGFVAGMFATIPLSNNFSLQPEISYNTKGFEVGQGINLSLFNIDLPLGVSAVTEIDYLQIPILGRVEFTGETAGAYFLIGPSVSVATKGTLRTKVNSIIDFNITKTSLDLSNDNYKRMELAGMLGTGAYLNIGVAKLFTEIRYHHGFSNILTDPIIDIEIKNRAFSLGIGIQFEI